MRFRNKKSSIKNKTSKKGDERNKKQLKCFQRIHRLVVYSCSTIKVAQKHVRHHRPVPREIVCEGSAILLVTRAHRGS
jgi:hypothetical protein